MAAFKSSTGESKVQFKARLIAEGRWRDCVARREGLVRDGMDRKMAWRQVMDEYAAAGLPAGGFAAAGSGACAPQPESETLPAVVVDVAGLLPDSGLVEIVNSPVGGSGNTPFSGDASSGAAGRCGRREEVMRPVMPAGGGVEIGGPTAFEVGEEELPAREFLEWVLGHLDCEEAELGRVPNRMALNLWRAALDSKDTRNELWKQWFKLTGDDAKSSRLFADDGRELVELIDRILAAAVSAEGGKKDEEDPY